MKFVPWKGIEIPEPAKFLPMKSGILGFGMQNTAQETGIGNPGAADKELGIHSWNPEPVGWNGECKTLLDSLTWGECNKEI